MFAPVDQSQALGVIFTAVQEIALMQIGKPLLNMFFATYGSNHSGQET